MTHDVTLAYLRRDDRTATFEASCPCGWSGTIGYGTGNGYPSERLHRITEAKAREAHDAHEEAHRKR